MEYIYFSKVSKEFRWYGWELKDDGVSSSTRDLAGQGRDQFWSNLDEKRRISTKQVKVSLKRVNKFREREREREPTLEHLWIYKIERQYEYSETEFKFKSQKEIVN